MRLADFIRSNIEPILVDWESFARGIWPEGTPPDTAALRDHAEQILAAVVADMDSDQSLHAQSEKSMGRGATGIQSTQLDHASEIHGAARVGSGLSLPTVVAEYRALRGSVLRLWRKSVPAATLHDLDDITRFNEAIDQSLGLAIDSFTHRLDSGRKMFLGILAHDLRNPLSAITLTSTVASMSDSVSPEMAEHLSQINSSAGVMNELITHLIDFTTTAVGGTLRMSLSQCDLNPICLDVIRELRAANPRRNIQGNIRGDLKTTCDCNRLRQMMGNLIANAIQHGSHADPIQLTADGTDSKTILISVHNTGEPIPPNQLPTIFDPLTRGTHSIQNRPRQGSIGLGLYIVREIAIAHSGTVDITSTAAQGTTVTIHLPRHDKK